jgi:hypothetical protein
MKIPNNQKFEQIYLCKSSVRVLRAETRLAVYCSPYIFGSSLRFIFQHIFVISDRINDMKPPANHKNHTIYILKLKSKLVNAQHDKKIIEF